MASFLMHDVHSFKHLLALSFIVCWFNCW